MLAEQPQKIENPLALLAVNNDLYPDLDHQSHLVHHHLVRLLRVRHHRRVRVSDEPH